MKHLITIWRQDEGQDLVEYGLLVCLIAVAAIGVVTTVGQTVRDAFWNVIAAALP